MRAPRIFLFADFIEAFDIIRPNLEATPAALLSRPSRLDAAFLRVLALLPFVAACTLSTLRLFP
jgi:hypothetical protein